MKSIPLIIHLCCSSTIRAGYFTQSYMNGESLLDDLVSPSGMMWGITWEFVLWSCFQCSQPESVAEIACSCLRSLEACTFLVLSALQLVESCLVLMEDCFQFTSCDSGCGVLFHMKDSWDLAWVSVVFYLNIIEVARAVRKSG